jgi:S1-C subfamily serine protease
MLDASGIDMTFEIAQAMGTNVTYGWLVLDAAESTGLRGSQIQAVVAGSTMRIGGDIVTGIDGVRITNSDGLLAYLEEYTLPGQTVDLTVVRNNEVITVQATLGKLS